MLIIEGPDLVGKTTLAHKAIRLLNDANFPHVYHHLSRLPKAWKRDAAMNYRRLATPYVVQDRFHMSDPLYAELRGEPPVLSPSEYHELDGFLHFMGVYQLTIVADEELIVERYEKHAQREMYRLEDVLRVNKLYINALRAERHKEYIIRCDGSFHCSRRIPFVTDDWLRLMLRDYMLRLKRVAPYFEEKHEEEKSAC